MLPDGAALSGLIVALVLSPREPWYVPVEGGALAVASKHLIRTPRLGRPHVFNPAAFALLACALPFSSTESWWGALPELPAPALLPLLAAGYHIADRVNKLPQVLSFAATYVGLLTFAVLLTHGASPRLAALYRTPFVNAAPFLAFFMLTDPPTSPNRTDEQIAFGFVVGLVTYGAFLALPGLTFLLLGLLSGNVWLAWRRMQRAGQAARGREREQRAYQR